jgi:DNA helicase HerA-like ATPase
MSQAELPVPAEGTRRYWHITPTDTPLDPAVVTRQLQRLHQLDPPTDGLTDRLLGEDPPLFEVLITTDGTPDTGVDYYVGTDTADLEAHLEQLLRAAYPTGYECETVQRPPPLPDTTDPTAVTYDGVLDRPSDWQTRLTPLEAFQGDDHTQPPLSAVVDHLAEATSPAAFQVLWQPKPDWSTTQEMHRQELREGSETLVDQLLLTIWGRPEGPTEIEIPPADEDRLDELEAKNPRRSFEVNVRAVVAGEDHATARALASAYSEVSQSCYDLDGQLHTGSAAATVRERLQNRTLKPANYDRLTNKLPLRRPRSRGLVADATELASLVCVDGAGLTTAARRALGTTPGERELPALPPARELRPYRTDGLALGTPLTRDHTPQAEAIALPPELQTLHVAWVGKTGSGKSTGLVNAILRNQQATEGADILIDPKGDGMARAYMRAHYAQHGDLEDVLYFDCAEVLPALTMFDIREQLAAGIPRTTAVENTVDHYLEMLRAIMGADRFEQAVRSPDVIRYLVKALFDPVNGDDAFPHSDLHMAAQEMHERETAPAVSDDDLERMLEGVVANSSRSFDEIMQGVANRLEKVPVDRRLATIFNHVPGPDEAHFDVGELIDEDVVIVIDTGRLRQAAQRVLTLVILSKLWAALKRREQETPHDETHTLVNVYLEEAASVASSDILQELLGQARSFDLSMTLAMQHPGQLEHIDDAVYDELLTNVSTYVVGNVPDDGDLATRLATADMRPDAAGRHLRALRRGEWLVALPGPFDAPEPRPFQVESLSLPPGHPDGPRATVDAATLDRAIEDVVERTRAGHGLVLGQPSTTEPAVDQHGGAADRLDSALPYTQRLPETVAYDEAAHGLRCVECESRYGPSIDGMRRAIGCCDSLAAVDRDDIPVCSVPVKLDPEERAATDWSDRQLLFLQAVYDAQQLRFEPLEYDLLSDSMLRLQEYVGIDSAAVTDLLEAGVLREDTTHPHKLFSVTPAGRDVLGESYRRGVEYGHGKGDLEESSAHVLMVELGRRYLDAEYVADEDSPVVEVVPYYEPSPDQTADVPAAAAMGTETNAIESGVEDAERRRLDVAGLDADGDVVVAFEAERINNDVHRAVPADFDKMAACDVEAAIWGVMTQADGHQVLSVLNNPPEGEPRVEKTYAETTPPQQFRIDTPGCSAIYPVEWLRKQVDLPD